MAKVYVDDKSFEMDDSQNLLHACLSKGLSIPFFCWHPAMGSVGACRQCAVKLFRDENDKKGRIVMSCMTPVKDGMRVSIEDPEVKDFRARVIEWLMINHPHDCPVCDEGGECHLQDMTLMTGHIYRRYRFKKRTFVNQDIGPFVNHEMNRCIACYRCVRYYKDYAGGTDLVAQACHHLVYFGREREGALENEFSGNLVEICPTGVFTDKTLKQHYTRKWDLQTAPSVCVHCSVGCNTFPGERYGELRRIHSRYNSEVNRYFLCDRGRYGYEFVNSGMRINRPIIRDRTRTTPDEKGSFVTKQEAIEKIAASMKSGKQFIGIGSPRASLEANFALRSLVGQDRFFLGISDNEYDLLLAAKEILSTIPVYGASLPRMEKADVVVVLGEDVTNTAPLMALAMRQSIRRKPMRRVHRLDIPEWNDGAVRDTIRHEKGPFYVLSPYPTKLDDIATQVYRAAPDEIARIGFAIAHAVNGKAPKVENLSKPAIALVEHIAAALYDAEHPLIVSGISSGSKSLLHAAANLALSLCEGGCPGRIAFALPECNSMGLALMGGQRLGEAFDGAKQGEFDGAVILENDLYRRADEKSVDAFFENCPQVVAIDHLYNRTTSRADAVLPAGTFAESDGTLVNYEGRAQRFYQVFVPGGNTQESWKWIRDIGQSAKFKEAEQWKNLDSIVFKIAGSDPLFDLLSELAPPAGFRMAGQKIAREPHRYSGRTAMHANVTMHEPKPPEDPDSALSFSMEGYDGPSPPAPLVPRFWAPAWNSVQSVTRFQEEVNGPLRGGPEGKRLVEPPESDHFYFFEDIPQAFQKQQRKWLILPRHYIFGSEELSILTPGVAQRAPHPYISLAVTDARLLGISEEDEAEVILGETLIRVPVEISEGVPEGVATIPAGLPQLQSIMLPFMGSIRKVESA